MRPNRLLQVDCCCLLSVVASTNFIYSIDLSDACVLMTTQARDEVTLITFRLLLEFLETLTMDRLSRVTLEICIEWVELERNALIKEESKR